MSTQKKKRKQISLLESIMDVEKAITIKKKESLKELSIRLRNAQKKEI